MRQLQPATGLDPIRVAPREIPPGLTLESTISVSEGLGGAPKTTITCKHLTDLRMGPPRGWSKATAWRRNLRANKVVRAALTREGKTARSGVFYEYLL